MNNIILMQTFKSLQYLMSSFPDKLLIKSIVPKSVESGGDHSFEVTTISVLHHNAQGLNILDVEGGFVRYDIGHVD